MYLPRTSATRTPYQRGTLEVSGLHTLSYTQSGNPNGVPVVFLHGGPGGFAQASDRALFDLDAWRVIQFDQRGCGNSTPFGELTENTTAHLLADIEQLREHLRIEQWAVAGSSWGTALSLAYAQKHPERVTALTLWAIFLSRPEDLTWVFEPGGVSDVLPHEFAAYADGIDSPDGLISEYGRRLYDSDLRVARDAAERWIRVQSDITFPRSLWSSSVRSVTRAVTSAPAWGAGRSLSLFDVDPVDDESWGDEDPFFGDERPWADDLPVDDALIDPEAFAIEDEITDAEWDAILDEELLNDDDYELNAGAFEPAGVLGATAGRWRETIAPDPDAIPHEVIQARLEHHYMSQDCFITTDLLTGCAAIAHLPVEIIHGTEDQLCPVSGAEALHAALPGSTFTPVTGAGHCGGSTQVRAANERMLERVR